MHIMIDIETLGTNYNSVVVSIGAVEFNMETGELGREFYIEISPESSCSAGLKISEDTLKWWAAQSPRVRSALKGTTPLDDALDQFSAWVGNDKKIFWAWGASFDYPILDTSYKAVGKMPPWKYWNCRCARTVSDMLGKKILREDYDFHHALDDARTQAQHMINITSG